MVATAESTRRLLGNLFELQGLGIQDLKGIAGPVRACSAVRQLALSQGQVTSGRASKVGS
jgi:class 3 adenylate cyclase